MSAGSRRAGGAPVSAAGLARAAGGLITATRGAGGTIGSGGPVVLAALVLALILGVRLGVEHGNPTGLIQFGRIFAPHTHPPVDGLVQSRFGYDGQFYWLQATDPLLRHGATIADLDAAGRGYDLQRMAYPLLADALAGGSRSVLPWTLLAVNVIAILALTAAVSRFARERGRSVWWGLAAGLTPGLVMGTLRDLSDPLATAALIGGLVAHARDRRLGAAALLTLAVLAREPMIVGVAAVAADALGRLWVARHDPASRRRIVRVWPVIVLPAVAFLAWQAYTRGLPVPRAHPPISTGTGVTSAGVGSDTLALPPGSNIRTEIRRTLSHDAAGPAIWELAYWVLLAAGAVSALALVRRGLRAATVTALLSAAIVTVIFLGDQWGVSRYGAPVLGALLVAGLQLRSRAVPWVCALAVVLTLAIPVIIPGG